jgi:hypothetical protein
VSLTWGKTLYHAADAACQLLYRELNGPAIGFPKMFRAILCRHDAERFTVSRHENRDLTGNLDKMQQRSVDLCLQVGELRKIL